MPGQARRVFVPFWFVLFLSQLFLDRMQTNMRDGIPENNLLTNPHCSPGGEMITQRFGLTKDFTKKWNNRVYSRLSKMRCGSKDQVRACPSGEKCGLSLGG
jgi:hypothetical protein